MPDKPMSTPKLEQKISDLQHEVSELKAEWNVGGAGGGLTPIEGYEKIQRLETEIERLEAQLAERQAASAAAATGPSDPFHLDGLDEGQLRAKLDEINKQMDVPVDERFQTKLGEHFNVYKADHPDAVLDNATTAMLRDEIGQEMREESERLEKTRDAIQDRLSGDTGHYDDGHSFGWNRPEKPTEDNWTNLTGKTPSSSRNLRIGAGIAAAALVIGGLAVALGGGDDKPKTQPAGAGTQSHSSSSSGNTADPKPVGYTMDVTQTVGPPSCTTTRLIKVQFAGDVSKIANEKAILHIDGPGGTDMPFTVPPSGAIDLTFVENVPATANGCSGQWEYSVTSVAGRPAERQLSG